MTHQKIAELDHAQAEPRIAMLKPLPGAQVELIHDTASPIIAFIGGMSSGKTHVLVMKALVLGWANPGCVGLFVEPTYGLCRDIALVAFRKVLDDIGVAYVWHATYYTLTIGSGAASFIVHLRSGEKPERFIGTEYAWSIIDEPGLQKRSVFVRVEQRTRAPCKTGNQVILGGTPEGFNWLHDICEKRPLKGLRLLRARTVENPFRRYDYVDRLRSTCTASEAEAYLEGRFVNLTSGRVYQSFDRAKQSGTVVDPFAGRIVVGCDFNVGKMCWVIGSEVGGTITMWSELSGRNTNTYRQTEALVELLANARQRLRPWDQTPRAEALRGVHVYSDATGSARKTAATESDHAILRGAGALVMSEQSNPPIRDRVYTVELAFRRRALVIDTAACVDLTHALESQGWGHDGLPIKGDGEADVSGHVDALGYLAFGQIDWRSTIPRGNLVTGYGVSSYR